MSMSISRGPFRKVGVRPTDASIACTARNRLSAERLQRMRTTAFQKAGWASKPTGSVRYSDETPVSGAIPEISRRARSRWARRSPRLEPSAR
jgi:hypothetical protein